VEGLEAKGQGSWGKIRKQNHCVGRPPLFLKEGPPRALGKSPWRTPSARTARSLTKGLGPMSHATGAPAPKRRKGEPPHPLPRRLEATTGGHD
jgi:hypothetical protein